MAERKTLIITAFENDEVDAVAEFLDESDYFILFNEHIHSRYHFVVLPDQRKFTIHDEETQQTIHAEELASIWVAGTKLIYEEGFVNNDELAVFTGREYSSLIDALIAIAEDIGCTIINHPSVTNHAGDKIRQQLAAMRHGFKIPRQLITNRKETFVGVSWAGNSIFKPIHSSNLHPNPADDELYIAKPVVITQKILKDITSGKLEIGIPHFQEKLEKIVEYRVVTFNKKSYPFRITGQHGFDWRGYMDNISFELDDTFPLVAPCQAFVRDLGITLGAFDFIETTEGIYFIECNPPGYFLFCDPGNTTGMISDFAKYLLQ